MKRLRLLLAEGHPLLRQTIAEVITRMPRVKLVAKVGNVGELMPIAAQLKLDIILLGFSLPGLSGLEVTNLIKRQLPQIRVVILLDEEDERYIKAVEQSEAWGYLVKSQVAQKLPPLLDKLELSKRGNDCSN